jgi:hypothetical protein
LVGVLMSPQTSNRMDGGGTQRLDQLEWLKNHEDWVLYVVSISPAGEHDWLYRELQLIRDIKAVVAKEKEDE